MSKPVVNLKFRVKPINNNNESGEKWLCLLLSPAGIRLDSVLHLQEGVADLHRPNSRVKLIFPKMSLMSFITELLF